MLSSKSFPKSGAVINQGPFPKKIYNVIAITYCQVNMLCGEIH
jgi:hypothetical protein